MRRSRCPLALVILAGLAMAAVGRTAAAQGILTKDDFVFRVQRADGSNFVDLTATESTLYFNRARCDCAAPIRIIAGLSASGVGKRSMLTMGNIRMMVGSNCTDPNTTERDKRCRDISTAQLLTGFLSMTADVDVRVLSSPKADRCDVGTFDQTVWLLVDYEANDTPDLVGDAAPTVSLAIDTEAPPPPEVTSVRGGNEALAVSWTAVTMTVADVAGYQLFCSRGEDLAVFKKGTFTPGFQSAAQLCPSETIGADAAGSTAGTVPGAAEPTPPPAVDTPTTLAVSNGTAFPAFGPIAALDPAFICSGLMTAQQTSGRIAILQNGISYLVGLASIDKHGNASPIEVVYLQTPVPSTDFWRGYRMSGQADGGYCAVGGPHGSGAASLVLVALWAATRWRRRGPR